MNDRNKMEELEDKAEKRYSKVMSALGVIIAIEVILFLLLATYLFIFTGAVPNR